MLASCTSYELENQLFYLSRWNRLVCLLSQHVILLGACHGKDRGGPIEKRKSQSKLNRPKRWPNRPPPSRGTAVRQRFEQPILRLGDSYTVLSAPAMIIIALQQDPTATLQGLHDDLAPAVSTVAARSGHISIRGPCRLPLPGRPRLQRDLQAMAEL